MSIRHRNLVLFGGSGQIGEALQRCAQVSPAVSFDIRRCSWSTVAGLNPHGLADHIREISRDFTGAREGFDVVFANGLTDPIAGREELVFSNVLFPMAVIDATVNQGTTRYLTLGTVFEEFEQYASANPYIHSKRELCDALLRRTSLVASGRILHLRLHTVYGGAPKPFMFLGQLLNALEQSNEFRMTSGEQLREYHHVNDIAGAIIMLLQREWSFALPIVELNSGLPVQLADLAKALFADRGRLDLLRIGALEGAPGDNRDQVFQRSDPAILPYFRDPIVGVLEYVRARRDALCQMKG